MQAFLTYISVVLGMRSFKTYKLLLPVFLCEK